MKKLLLFAVMMFGMLLHTQAQTKTYTINGVVNDSTLNHKTVSLIDYGTGNRIGSCVIKDCKFSFTGNVDNLTVLRIDASHLYANLLADEGIIEVKLNSNSSQPYTISGTTLNDKMSAYEKECYITYDNYKKLTKNMTDKKAIDSLEDRFRKSRVGIENTYLKENQKNALGIFITWEKLQARNLPVIQIDSLLSLLSETGRNFNPLKRMRKIAVEKELTNVGKMFLDFQGVNADGVAVKLSDYVGKGNYVLIDFWASWCGPCKAEVPAIKKVYSVYKEKGLVVLGINVWDKKADFQKAMEELDMPWNQICLFNDEETLQKYGIDGIPHIILFAPDGTIVARDLRGEKMKAKIAEIYAK